MPQIRGQSADIIVMDDCIEPETDTCPPLITPKDVNKLKENVKRNMGISVTRYRCPYENCFSCGFKSVQEVKSHGVDKHGVSIATSQIERGIYIVKL
jgi:hypothetical protein